MSFSTAADSKMIMFLSLILWADLQSQLWRFFDIIAVIVPISLLMQKSQVFGIQVNMSYIDIPYFCTQLVSIRLRNGLMSCQYFNQGRIIRSAHPQTHIIFKSHISIHRKQRRRHI